MNVLGGGGHGGLWGWNPSPRKPKQQRKRRFDSKSQSSNSVEASGGAGHWFPLKQAVTAGSLVLTGDTIAQLSQRWTKAKALNQQDGKDALLSDHDWLRALRMTSYGFLLYGPGSYAWYQFLDHSLPATTVGNLLLKLPDKYRRDAFPTLLYGFRFWIPVSLLNFWVIPLQARVAFMSVGSIFWNFCLSSTLSK
ncbi:protein Mpv17 isoform X2 [Prunus persica]|uniref:protein Mpv17 isoform X2 n=1 Tax=Prunus persica TaxID=3760 RepID=UPI0009AB787E|nr:protein Mpv17 isoform X2 [Prunus persica]